MEEKVIEVIKDIESRLTKTLSSIVNETIDSKLSSVTINNPMMESLLKEQSILLMELQESFLGIFALKGAIKRIHKKKFLEVTNAEKRNKR